MKTTTLKVAAAFGLGALLAGSAAAQESVSKPVGYETLDVATGFNYIGVRLHEAPAASGAADSIAETVVTVPAGSLDGLTEGTAYIFEVTDGDATGAVVIVEAFDAVAGTVTLSDDLSDNFEEGNLFTIRPSSTLVSLFGEASDDALAAAAAPGDGDQVWVPNMAGGFDKFYKYSFFGISEWRGVDSDTAVDGNTISVCYTDGMVINAVQDSSVVFSGSVKLGASSFGLAEGFNYLGSIYPVGATLDNFFGPLAQVDLDTAAAPGDGDQVWVASGSSFTKYYVYSFFGVSEWRSVSSDTAVADPATIDLSTGFLVLNVGGAGQVGVSAPLFYADL